MTPVMLVPGLLVTAEAFAPQVAALWPHAPVMVASTMRGGTVAEIAEAILAAAPPRFALAGISMGGFIALEIMRTAPGRVERLALLGTTARADTPEQVEERGRWLAAVRADFDGFMSQALPAILHPSRRNDDDLVGTHLRMGRAVGIEAVERQIGAIATRPDVRSVLPAIAVPTLVLVGDGDAVQPPELSKELAAGIDGARLVIVPKCGHSSTLERPEIVSQALVDWLA